MTNYNLLSVASTQARADGASVSPRTEDGWCNGNPREQIKLCSYKRFRGDLRGFTQEQMDEFDGLDERVNGKEDKTVMEKKIAKKAKDAAKGSK